MEAKSLLPSANEILLSHHSLMLPMVRTLRKGSPLPLPSLVLEIKSPNLPSLVLEMDLRGYGDKHIIIGMFGERHTFDLYL